MKNLNKLALFVALGAGIAIAQSTPQGSQSTPSSSSSSSTQAPDQSAQPSTDQSKQPANAPEQMPKTDQSSTSQSSTSQSSTSDQSKSTDKSSDQSSKLPQSDASAASSGDVASQVQSALQQDPKLSGANITAKVNGKDLELNGTVQSADEKKQAEKVAKSNAGSLKVKNHIKVASANTGATDKDKGGSTPPKY